MNKADTEPFYLSPAGFWRRLGAVVIDRVFIMIFWFAIEVFMGNDMFFKTALYLLILFVYYVGLWASDWHATLGKRIFNVYIVDYNGDGIQPLRAISRFFTVFIPYIPTLILLLAILYRGSESHAAVLNIPYQKIVLQWLSIASALFYVILTFIWYVPIPFSKTKKGMHDRICRTRVVMGRP